MRIRLWNAQGSNENLQVLLETLTEDILAIQEPWLNPQTSQGTYCPARAQYYLAYKPRSRAALYIHKSLALEDWTLEAYEDWVTITIKKERAGTEKDLQIWSIYNPPPNHYAL